MFGFNGLLNGVFIVASMLVMGACDQTKPYTDQERVQRAKDFQAQGKLESAVIEFRNALQQNPKNAEARLRLGEIYVTQGLGEQAEKELQRAKELGTDVETLKVPTGQALLLQGKFQRVVAEIQPTAQSSPQQVARILELQGRARLGLRHFEEGCKLFVQSAEKDPQYVSSYWGMARCAAVRGKLDEARANLEKALKLDDKNSTTWTLIGDLERALQKLPEAETAYGNALKYDGNNLDALLARASARIDSNKLDEASQDIDAASRITRDHPIVTQMRGVLQYRQGKYAAAETSFQSVLKVDPNYLPAVLWLGLANFTQGNFEQAGKQFSQFNRTVRSVRVQALLALVQVKLGRGGDAEESLKVLRGIDIKDPQSLALVATTYMSLGDTDLAAAYMAKAVEQQPEAPQLRVGLATTLAKKGERSQAIEELQSAIQLDPGMVNAQALLIQNLLRAGQLDRALAAVEALEKKQPQNPITFNLKGAVYLARNDIAAARKNFEQALALKPDYTEAAMNLAQVDLLDKNPDAARRRLQGVLDKNPKNVQVMIGLAGVAAAARQDAEYVSWLEKAANADASAVRPRVLLANYYLKKNNLRKALEMAAAAQRADPKNPHTLDLLGTVQLANGERENAISTYSKLVRAAPRSAVAHYKLATAQAAAENTSAARSSLNRALALRPDYWDAEMLLVSLELNAGRHAEAVKVARQMQKQRPDSASGFMLQGDALMAQKQYGPALDAYQKALAINRTGLIAVKVHQALSASGRAQEADRRLIAWLKDQPADVGARTYLAETYIKGGHNKEAIEQYELVLQMDPKNVRALNDLAWVYQQEKDPRSLATAEQAYQLSPENAQIMDTLGWILVERGEAVRGAELLKKAVEKAPASTSIRYHWAAALAKSGDVTRARQELADLLTKNKNFPQRKDAQALLRQL
jgi:putative PEP-CTERM system TPR-repeat lipoprotein